MAGAKHDYQLSQEQVDHFVQHGWIKLSNCFTKEQADDLQKNLWTRLGMDPKDMSTW
jgi:DNA polymerase IIIc chi subunit